MISIGVGTNIKKRLFPLGALALAACLLATGALAAGDAKAGRKKAEPCAVCHGQNGISTNPLTPNLAGQYAGYLVRQLQLYKNKERKDSVMNEKAQTLSTQDMEDIAAYYASMK